MKGLHTKTYRRVSPADRFPDFVSPEPNTGCWLWTGGVNACGYGVFGMNRGSVLAHRVSYALHVGEIPEGLCILHRCDVPCCVNPDHLFAGTQPENIADMEDKGRGRHPYGVKSGRAKLTDAIVQKIRADTRSGRTIGAEYGVDKVTIQAIKKRKTWKHVL